MLVVLALLVAIIALIFGFLHNRYSYWEKRGIPYEKPILLFGNMKGFGKTVHFRDLHERIYNRFKGVAPFAGLYLFVSKVVLAIDLDLIKNILIKDFNNFHDRGVYHNVKDDPLTGHLFSIDGEEWRAMRSKLTPVFTSGKMKFMFPTVVGVGENLEHACGMQMLKDKDRMVEVKELCARFTTDVIGTCAFGIECNSLEDPNAEFRQQGRDIFEKPRHSQMVMGMLISNADLARKLHMKLFPESVSVFFIDAVRRTVEYRIKNNVKRNDFMDLLIEMMAKDQDMEATGNAIDLSKGLTLLQMAAQAFVFFVAGFDTSSTTMSFCLYELALNTEIQDKVRAEILTVLAKHNGELTYEAMKEMHYLEWVIKETLRKHPILPHLMRKTKNDYHVPNSNYIIEAGTTILIPAHTIQHDPEIYPDPEKFDPARFEPEAVQKRHQCAYLPFGDGPRNCIGLRFGMMQTTIGIISLLKNYKFSKSKLTENPPVLSKNKFLLNTEKGIHLNVDRI